MSIYVIGDLHLSFSTDKPMDVFGEHWQNHFDKIKKDWLEKVNSEDLVIISGDSSWAMSFEEADEDLSWLDQLPGKKVLIKGNHDFWWSSKKKMDGKYESLEFIHNSFSKYGDTAICGTRGWLCPNDSQFDENDLAIYKREAMRLENSIQQALQQGFEKIIVALHFPPTNDKQESSFFTEIIKRYSVNTVVYGHVHSKEYFKLTLQGEHFGTMYFLTSCDYLEFKLLKLGT